MEADEVVAWGTADAILAGLVRFRQPAPFLYTFVDYVLLMARAPIGLHVLSREGTFTVGPDLGAPAEVSLPGREAITVRIHGSDAAVVAKQLERTLGVMLGIDSTAVGRVAERLAAALRSGKQYRAPSGVAKGGASLPAHLEGFADAVRQCLRSELATGGAPWFFAVLRETSDPGHNIYHLLCTSREPETNAALDHIGHVQGALTDGVVQWSRTALGQAICIPCTVGTEPWVGLVLVHADRQAAWLHAMWLYRDLLPRLFQQIREIAAISFAQELRGHLPDHPSLDLRVVNAAWAQVTCFPFDSPVMEPVAPGTALRGTMRLPDGRLVRVALASQSNGSAPSWDAPDIERHLVRTLRDHFQARTQQSEMTAQDLVHEFTHLIAPLATLAGVVARRANGLENAGELQVDAQALWFSGSLLSTTTSTLYRLIANQGSVGGVEARADPDLLVASAVIAIHMLAREKRFDLTTLPANPDLEHAINMVSRHFQTEPDLMQLFKKAEFSLLLFAVNEPIRNIRPLNAPFDSNVDLIQVRASADPVAVTGPAVHIDQWTVEAVEHTMKDCWSKGIERVNRLLPPDLCRIDPCVRYGGATPIPGREAVRVHRRTTIFVLGGRPVSSFTSTGEPK
jgi:hypothetical protein